MSRQHGSKHFKNQEHFTLSGEGALATRTGKNTATMYEEPALNPIPVYKGSLKMVTHDLAGIRRANQTQSLRR